MLTVATAHYEAGGQCCVVFQGLRAALSLGTGGASSFVRRHFAISDISAEFLPIFASRVLASNV
jgi:hypothetical protein